MVGEKDCESEVSFPKTQHFDPVKGSNSRALDLVPKGTSLSSWEVSSIIIINQHAYPLCVHKALQLRFPTNKMLTIIPLAQVEDIIFTPYPTRANEIIVV